MYLLLCIYVSSFITYYVYIYVFCFLLFGQCTREFQRELASAISSIISPFEIRGHCIAGRDLVSGTNSEKGLYIVTFV
jgi:hypothetical protein